MEGRFVLSSNRTKDMPNQVDNQGMIVSVDVKRRLKWTRQLHEQFVDAVAQLGGAESKRSCRRPSVRRRKIKKTDFRFLVLSAMAEATPKSVMHVMAVPGLTLFHLKSHLQKYRIAKNRDVGTTIGDKKPNCMIPDELKGRDDDSPHLDQALLQHIQIDVQRKLQEQIEVQKHLQLRIEAQGKYLQSVLKKAQETLAGYTSNHLGSEAARTELSQLATAVETECMRSYFTHGDFIIIKQNQNTDSSMGSSLTSENLELRENDAGQHRLEVSSVSNPVNGRKSKARGEIEEFDLNK